VASLESANTALLPGLIHFPHYHVISSSLSSPSSDRLEQIAESLSVWESAPSEGQLSGTSQSPSTTVTFRFFAAIDPTALEAIALLLGHGIFELRVLKMWINGIKWMRYDDVYH
jgi:hypothetical protein